MCSEQLLYAKKMFNDDFQIDHIIMSILFELCKLPFPQKRS